MLVMKPMVSSECWKLDCSVVAHHAVKISECKCLTSGALVKYIF